MPTWPRWQFFFFFQAEDGIRDYKVTGVQTCALPICYGSRFTAEGPLRLGTVACGYADGYPRHCGTGTPVLVNGVRTRTLGCVSMDMLAVDLTPVPDAGMGSEVTLDRKSTRLNSSHLVI